MPAPTLRPAPVTSAVRPDRSNTQCPPLVTAAGSAGTVWPYLDSVQDSRALTPWSAALENWLRCSIDWRPSPAYDPPKFILRTETGHAVAGYEFVTYDTYDDGKIAKILLNRPETRNAQSRGLLVDLNDAFLAAEADDRVRVVIL